MIADLIAVLFLSRDIAHREHLTATGDGSYARHMALGDFYPAVIELADRLAEAHMGRHGLITKIPLAEHEGKSDDAAAVLAKHLEWVEANRYKAAPKDDSALQNIIDEIVSLYLGTLYKLRFLR